MNKFYKVVTVIFRLLMCACGGCIAVLFLFDSGARYLKEDFNRTPLWIYFALVAGVAIFAVLAWISDWHNQPVLKTLPPNPTESEPEFSEEEDRSPLQIVLQRRGEKAH
jgi:hypothetical protein